jgi:broad specificity phosphatase PhoE
MALGIIATTYPEKTVVAGAHTDFNRTMLLLVLGLSNERLWRLRQDNCAINEIELAGSKMTLASMNDTSHLRVEAS